MNDFVERVRWLLEDVVTLPSAQGEPPAFTDRTRSKQAALFSGYELQRVQIDLSHSEPGAGDPRLLLYWAIARASGTVMPLVGRKREDLVTSDFLHALERELNVANEIFSTQLHVSHDTVFANVGDDGVGEDVTGADVLFVFKGGALVPGRGVRLVWVQFKHSTLKERRWQLDVFRPLNETKVRQFTALNQMNDGTGKAVSIYALAHGARNYYAAVPAADVYGVDASDKRTSRFDLGEGGGVRLQELLTGLVSSTEAPPFRSAKEVVDYLRPRLEKQTYLRLEVVGVSNGPSAELDAMKQLVADISELARDKLDEAVESARSKGIPEAQDCANGASNAQASEPQSDEKLPRGPRL